MHNVARKSCAGTRTVKSNCIMPGSADWSNKNQRIEASKSVLVWANQKVLQSKRSDFKIYRQFHYWIWNKRNRFGTGSNFDLNWHYLQRFSTIYKLRVLLQVRITCVLFGRSGDLRFLFSLLIEGVCAVLVVFSALVGLSAAIFCLFCDKITRLCVFVLHSDNSSILGCY